MLDERFLQEPKIKTILDCLRAKDLSGADTSSVLPKDLENALDTKCRCLYRDVFVARLDNFHSETNNSLLTAVCGEIGNNAFDHNPGAWRDIAGLYFNWEINGFAIFIDRGKGVLETLSKVMPNIATAQEALRVAFTERISGRSPEQRGNGLKFVVKVATTQKWDLYFQSGTGFCEISNGQMNFGNVASPVFGCVALLKYK
ncbi:hypothetical protein NO2_1005 [Candidatus Termititenax persephonae]|uniref:Uncharacterized protein n=1 Tax=Candidatus Termititenax persephonae TaxID=2218525 RepID=A0A388THV6_9BACT|nr:hypothetical protein NO2_1005 [Candidatus Termititenax persephonae]